jgi:hypothetical protein
LPLGGAEITKILQGDTQPAPIAGQASTSLTVVA